MTATITKTIIDHASGTVHCYYDAVSGALAATNQHAQFSEAESPLSKPDWTNADIVAALAAKLGIPAEAITVAEPPVPTEDAPLADPNE